MVSRPTLTALMMLVLVASSCSSPSATMTGDSPTQAGSDGDVIRIRTIADPESDVIFENANPQSDRKPYGELRQVSFSDVGSDFSPTISAVDGTFIAFASTRHSQNPDIYIKTINGRRVMQKTNSRASDIHPALSPDGRFLAFASNRNGSWDIFVTTARKEGPVKQLTRSLADEITPAWSHDGTRIVYSAKARSGVWEMWILNLKSRSLTNIGPGLHPDWHPKKDIIAFQRPKSRGSHWYSIWTVDTSGNNLTEIVPNTNWAAINPSWSPDGEKIAFATVHKSPYSKEIGRTQQADDIWVVNADGTALMQLTTSSEPDWNPRWGPDGRIYYTSLRNGRKNIWSLRPDAFDLDLASGSTRDPAKKGDEFRFGD